MNECRCTGCGLTIESCNIEVSIEVRMKELENKLETLEKLINYLERKQRSSR